MKKILYYSALGCILSFTACSSLKKKTATTENKDTVANTEITDVKWKLIELAGNQVADKVNGKEPFLLLHTEDSRYSASGGCNGLGGTYTLAANSRIKFSQGMSTMMACEDMTIEMGLNKVFSEADNYTVSGNELSLNKARMAPLARFQKVEANAESHVLNGTWEVNYVSGPRIAFEGLYPDKKPTITFDLPAVKATGNSSCNNYNVSFTLEGNNIRFGDPASTKMACEGNGEATFFNTLKTVSTYSVSGTTLNLIMGDVAVMRLEKKIG